MIAKIILILKSFFSKREVKNISTITIPKIVYTHYDETEYEKVCSTQVHSDYKSWKSYTHFSKVKPSEKNKMKRWQKKAKQLLKEFGLNDYKFTWINTKIVYGQCEYKKKEIRLSKFLVINCKDEKEILDTLLHEIGHALCEPNVGHGYQWQLLGKKIGYNPSPYSKDDLNAYRNQYNGICDNGHINTKYGHKILKATYCCKKCPSTIKQWKKVKNTLKK